MREKNKASSRTFLLIFFMEVCLLLVCAFWAYQGIKSLTPTNISIQDMTCLYTVYHDGAFSVEGDVLNSGEELDWSGGAIE